MRSNQNLFSEAGRFWELLVGWTCAAISLASGSLLAILVYIVGWRNPREFGKHELFDAQTLVIFSLLLVIAVPFSVFASRLLLRNKSRGRLMSANVLRAWGIVFGIGSIAILIDSVVNKRWEELPHLWYTLTGSISMGVAAFVLARTWDRNDRIVRS